MTSPVTTHHIESDVALRDGSTALIRPVQSGDREGLLALMGGLSPQSRYFRFFTMPPGPDKEVARLLRADGVHTVAIVANADGRPVGVASYVRSGESAEVSFAVADELQGHGIGTRLLDVLSTSARRNGIRRFEADVLCDNLRMLQVFSDFGFALKQNVEAGVCHISLDLAPTEELAARSAVRARTSALASLRAFFEPQSVAVVGASTARGKIGAEVLHNLVATGYTGQLSAVHPTAPSIQGVPAYPRVQSIPDAPELVVISVPAPKVPQVMSDCVAAGAKAVVVLTAGFAESGEPGRALEKDLLDTVRQAGMRMVGPNCMGLLNTNPAVRLNATFAPVTPPAGRVAMLSQSGALGLAILEHARRLQIGLSTFVSVGNKADVSGNDLLQYWEQDPNTDVILLYLESFGNPRKFSQIARRVARRKPIIAVKAGRSHAGARAAASHTGALASSDIVVDALLEQCGVIRTDTMEELFDVTRLLAQQAVPRGRKVAILTNAGGPGILAADACAARGLDVASLGAETTDALRTFLPPAATVTNPVDMIATASPEQYERALAALLKDDRVDSVIVIYISPSVTGSEDIARAVSRARAADAAKPVLAVFMGSAPAAELLKPIPSFVFPEAAVAALARAAKYGAWRTAPAGEVSIPPGVNVDLARRLADAVLERGGGWARPDEAAGLLGAAGIGVARGLEAVGEPAAVRAARSIGYPVALKAFGPDIVHKTERKAIAINLEDDDAVRAMYRTFKSSLGEAMSGVYVQQMVDGGVEMLVGAVEDPSFGPVVACGLGGTTAEMFADTAFRVAPLTDRDAAAMLDSLRCKALLAGFRGSPASDKEALKDAVLRISSLVNAVPEIREIEINPLRVLRSGVCALDVRVRIEPPAPRPNLRRVEY